MCPLLRKYACRNDVKADYGVALSAENLSLLPEKERGLRIAAVLLSPVTDSDQQLERIKDEYEWSMSGKAERIIVSTTRKGSIGWELVTGFLRGLIEIHREYSPRICVANHNNSCLEQLDDLHQLFSTPVFSSIGLCLNVEEFQKAIVNPADAIINFSSKIQAVQLSRQSVSANADLDSENSVLRNILDTLQEEHYTGPVIVDSSQVELIEAIFGKHA